MATTYPQRKKKKNPTQQGGNPWLARTSPGMPNTSAMGFNNWKPPTGNFQPMQMPMPKAPGYIGPPVNGGGQGGGSGGSQWPGSGGPTGGGNPGPVVQGGGYPGKNPNTLIGMEGHDPLSKLRYWAAQGWLQNREGTGFNYKGENALSRFLNNPNAYFGGSGDGRPNPDPDNPGIPGGGDPGPVTEDPLDFSNIDFTNEDGAALAQQMGLPLDPSFTASLKMLQDALSQGRMSALNNYNTGTSQLNFYKDQGNRTIDSTMAARGLFGSGVERRDERLLGNEVAMEQMGLQNARTQGEAGAVGDFRRGLMEALLQLANRQALAGAQGDSSAPRF